MLRFSVTPFCHVSLSRNICHASQKMHYPIERATKASRAGAAVAVVAIAILTSLPWWGESSWMRTLVEFACLLTLAQMWNLLAGYAGLVSVGQQAFMGASGYALFVLSQTFGVNPFLAIFLSLLAPALLAIPCYGLLHRLEGPYFSIGTWVVAEVFRLVASNMGWLNAGAGMSLGVMKQYSGF